MLDRSILQGVVDLHIHAGPSVAKRSVDAVEALKEAEDAGYRAIVIKDHYCPTVTECVIAEQHLGNGKTKCFGGIVLNNSVGGLNCNAIDAAIAMGAKIVWMPTVSAKNHMDHHKGGFLGAGSMSVPEKPIYYLNESGKLIPEVLDVLRLMAEHKDIIFATGHGHRDELDQLIPAALEAGVEKVLVNHPMWQIEATEEDVCRWAGMGATIEFNTCIYENMVNQKTGQQMGPIPFTLFERYFDRLPIEKMVIDTDLGQSIFWSPVTGMYEFLNEIHTRFGISEEEINCMTKKNPAKLLDLV